MLFQQVLLFASLSVLGLAQNNEDVPVQCRSICQLAVDLRENCDDDSTSYRDCVCNAQNASSQIPLCAACVAATRGPDRSVEEVIRLCNFSTTTFNPSAPPTAAPSASPSASNGQDTSVTGSATPAPSGPAGSNTAAPGPSETTGSALPQSSNAAPTMGAGSFGAMGLGAIGLALGMM